VLELALLQLGGCRLRATRLGKLARQGIFLESRVAPKVGPREAASQQPMRRVPRIGKGLRERWGDAAAAAMNQNGRSVVSPSTTHLAMIEERFRVERLGHFHVAPVNHSIISFNNAHTTLRDNSA
jgi:hypothetical protein